MKKIIFILLTVVLLTGCNTSQKDTDKEKLDSVPQTAEISHNETEKNKEEKEKTESILENDNNNKSDIKKNNKTDSTEKESTLKKTSITSDEGSRAGQIHMKWDNSGSLAIVPEVDDFSIVDKIKVIVVVPDKHPEVKDISNDLRTMQSIVDGQIEEVFLDDDAVLICNEEDKLMNLKANRCVGNDIIAGTFFIAGDDGSDELVSLNEEQIKEYTDKFYEIEEHSKEEIHGRTGYKVYGY